MTSETANQMEGNKLPIYSLGLFFKKYVCFGILLNH